MSEQMSYKVDAAATWGAAVLMTCGPRMSRDGRQETTRDGQLKWQAEVVVTATEFGRPTTKVLKIGLIGPRNPGEGIAPGSPVQLVGLEVNVGPKRNRDNAPVPGVQIWYRADEIKALTGAKAA